MRGRGGRDIGRFLLSMVTFLAVAVGVPAGLVAVAQSRYGSANPLAGVGGGSASSLTDPITDQMVINGLIRSSLCVVWVAVVVIVVTTVLEAIHMVRHRGLSMPPVRGLGWPQRFARYIAIGLLVVVPVLRPTPTIASTITRAPTTEIEYPPSATTRSPIASDESAAETIPTEAGSHVVRPGESIYSIAETLAAGDDNRVIDIADAIIDVNLGATVRPGQRFTNPAYIEAGWVLQIPARYSTPDRPDPPAADDDLDTSRTYRVRAGDTLWDIADDQLGDATSWPEIWERNAGDDMGGGRIFDDPDLILPGWELRVADNAAAPHDAGDDPVPVADAIASEPPQSEVSTSETTEFETPNTPDLGQSNGEGQDVSAPDVVIDAADGGVGAATDPSAAASPGTGTPTAATSTTTTTTPPPVPDHDPSTVDAGPATPAESASAIRLEHAAMLAAGILALVAVRRRQRLRSAMPRHRVPEPRPDLIDTERRLRSIDAGERAMRVDVACRAAAWHLLGSGTQIGSVEVTSDGDIDLRLSDPATPPPPWSGTGQDWHLGAAVPIEVLSADARKVGMPCVALVQIGVTPAGADLLVDIEACGTLAIEAGERQATEIVTALAAGLASSIYAEVAHLIAVSLPPAALLGHRNAHRAPTAEAAIELAVGLAGSTVENERTSFELRSLHTGGEMWEPAIVILGTASGLTDDGCPRPGHGVGLVVPVAAGELTGASVRLVGDADGWRLAGFGTNVAVIPVGVSELELQAVDDILTDSERELESIELESVRDLQWVADTTNRRTTDSAETSEPFVETDHRILVGLLGAVQVTDQTGAPGRFERSKTVELIAWLATHRERSTRTGARTALWELDVRDATFANVVSEARRALARLTPPPEGEEWVARTLTDQLPLHAAVVTDADLVQVRLDGARVQPPAQAVDMLRPAVAMIRDMPFAGTNYLWPDAEGITSNLVLLAITAAAEFAGHALSLGDTDGVFWATGQGLKVLPGHEELIGLRMRAHARTGDLAGVRHEWESYERVLVADAWSDGEPAPKLLALRRELLASGGGEHRNVP